MFLDMARDCYESFVIYMFFALCYCYIGQIDRERCESSRIHAALVAKGSVDHIFKFPEWTGVCNTIDLSSSPGSFLFSCKRYILQFVLVKPLSTILAIALASHFDKYETGNFSLRNGYIYVTTIVNVSISLSMYWLVMFYLATKESLLPFGPVPKFWCIKGVLFFSYWQSVIIAVLVKLGIITDIPIIHYSVEHVAATVQNALICVEMLGFAVAHTFAFSAQPFYFLPTRMNSLNLREPVVTSSARAMLRNAIDLRDMVEDIQEVAPELPKFLRRNSALVIPAARAELRVLVPSAQGLATLNQYHSEQIQ